MKTQDLVKLNNNSTPTRFRQKPDDSIAFVGVRTLKTPSRWGFWTQVGPKYPGHFSSPSSSHEKHRLSEDEIREIEIDKCQVDIEKEPVALSYPDDFDADLVRRFIEGVKKVHQPLQQYREIEVLQQRRLGTIKDGIFTPNTACALAFARDPVALFPGCQVRFLRVDGEDEQSGANYNVIKTVPLEGPVPRLLEQTAEIVAGQLRDFSRLGDDGVFYSASEYPLQRGTKPW